MRNLTHTFTASVNALERHIHAKSVVSEGADRLEVGTITLWCYMVGASDTNMCLHFVFFARKALSVKHNHIPDLRRFFLTVWPSARHDTCFAYCSSEQ